MSGLLLPSYAPARTRRVVNRCLMAEPRLTRFLDTPGLLAAVSLETQRYRERMQRQAFLEEAARTPHRELATGLSLPGLATLRRMTGDALDDGCLQALKRIGRDPWAMRVLKHARKISLLLVLALDSPVARAHSTSGFLAEVGYTRRRWRPRWKSVDELTSFLDNYRPTTAIQSIEHYRHLRRRNYQLMGTCRFAHREQPNFPAPPWPGEPGYAVPLENWRDLIRESIEMKNCVGEDHAFLRNIQQGRTYLYRVEQAWGMSRATLYVENSDGLWRIREARGRGNQPLNRRELRCLATWVADHQRIADERRCLPEEPWFIRFGVS